MNLPDIHRIAIELGRSPDSLIGLDRNNDPFIVAATAWRCARAEWAANFWRDQNFPLNIHHRRVHYRLVALGNVVAPWTPRGQPRGQGEIYQNSDNHSTYLDRALLDAVYLGLIPADAFIDEKNPDPVLFLFPSQAAEVNYEWSDDAVLLGPSSVDALYIGILRTLPELPTVSLTAPLLAQRYHVEIWAEKATVSDILLPIGRRYGVNVIIGAGDLSGTSCIDVIKRMQESGRSATRILYVSDHDPNGHNMPIAVSVKIMFENLRRELGLDVQLRSVALTHDQCVELALPRTPPKKDDGSRTAAFEERFGKGIVELDALEAFHPGKLGEILTTEIKRYIDPTLFQRVEVAAQGYEADLARLNAEIVTTYGPEVDELDEELKPIRAELDEIRDEFELAVRKLARVAIEKTEPLWERTTPIFERARAVCQRALDELIEKAPDPEDLEWPEAEIGDEDPDPLFNSLRPYVEQIDRFNRHKPKKAVR